AKTRNAMRLLHFDALGRPVSTDFRGKTVPPYAILSHRWSGSEIFFEDISNGTYKEKEEAYQKLQFCAKQAAQDELHYFWIDTCCIDRWDLRERSKAINSMFQWYKNASRCYVFLSDVSVSTKTAPIQRSDWEASFRETKCKASLDQLIHDITSIPLAALRNCALGQFTVSERKQWANNRKITEEEDTIYCLLGIIGVSMPTAYGNAPSIIPVHGPSEHPQRLAYGCISKFKALILCQ
ncbi:hypothetical protein J1614_012230, partial [Plenodomus biglobosus]